MSIAKVEFRMFSGPAQVDLGGVGKPSVVELRFGPKGDTGNTGATGSTGATGPAGPNSVTSATSSDGTCQLHVDDLQLGDRSDNEGHTLSFRFAPVPYDGDFGGDASFLTFPPFAGGYYCLTENSLGVPDKLTNGTIDGTLAINSTSYTFGTGAASALKTALAIASADITDASATPLADAAVLYNEFGGIQATGFSSTDDGGGIALFNSDSTQSLELQHGLNIAHILYDGSLLDLNIQGLGNYTQTFPTGTGKFALTQTANGEPDKLTNGTISGTLAINSTSYTYGTGAASAHRTALGVASTQLQTESLFSLLTLQESDAGVYTANAGSASGGSDGDFISLSAGTANQRPNVYRLRNWNRNPGVSGTANSVTPVKLASAGNIYHLGSGANGASFRCGFGMVNGASAVAADANATTGRGFGWRIAWNSSTSKLEFNLWAHNGTTYVEGTGIDTGLGAGNLDGIFNIIVGLASDGTVTACTWFGSQTSTSSVPSTTPTATLAGGPTSGTFANSGIPLWIAAAHSTNAPASGNSIITRISNRKLALG